MTAPRTFRRAAGAALLAGLALVVSACGDETADDTGSARVGPKPAAASPVDLAPMLMRAGEVPGFRPGALPDARPRTRQTLTGVDAFAREMGLPPADVARLRREGFLAFTVGPIRGPRNTAGLTNAALYQTAQGARRSMARDLRPEVIRAYGPVRGLRFFAVRGVPGARGWAASEPAVANVLWVQGRCYLTLGNQGPGRLERRLAIGARAIYERTKGRCGDDRVSPRSGVASRVVQGDRFMDLPPLPGWGNEVRTSPGEFSADSPGLYADPEKAIAELRRDGFVAGITRMFKSEKDKGRRAAASSVVQMRDAKGAEAEVRRQLATLLKPPCPGGLPCTLETERYEVPGLPGAQGVQATQRITVPTSGEHPDVLHSNTLVFREGAFVYQLFVGELRPGAEREALIDAAKALVAP